MMRDARSLAQRNAKTFLRAHEIRDLAHVLFFPILLLYPSSSMYTNLT